jgi:DNA-binding NtrC family response regulator
MREPQDTSAPETLLVVDPDPQVLAHCRDNLRRPGRRLRSAQTAREGLAILHRSKPDLVVLGLDVRDLPGERALEVFLQRADVPVICLSAHPTVAGSVQAMRRGAQDYLGKPIAGQHLREAVDRALSDLRTGRQLRDAQAAVEDRYGFSHLLTVSPLMLRVFDQIRAVAPTDATVLVLGETGTGKELISRAIHQRSRRLDKPLIAINCGAFTESLLESELFGHEKGSFTGASGRRQGVFEMADGGTLFLDELGETTLNVQVNLLRVLEEMRFRRVGGSEVVQVDVRVIAATNVNLLQAVEDGSFREDLYYRLNVFPIRLPPLRERREDIPLLLRHFLDSAAKEYGLETTTVTPDALQCITSWHWPGNVRQLRALAERWVITRSGARLEVVDLPSELTGAQDVRGGSGPLDVDLAKSLKHNADDALRRVEKSYLHEVLKAEQGHMERSAKAAGITRRTLYAKMRSLGLDPEEYRTPDQGRRRGPKPR